MGLCKTRIHHDSTMVLVDKLTKDAHFIPLKSTFKTINMKEIFLKEIFRLHTVPKKIIFDWC